MVMVIQSSVVLPKDEYIYYYHGQFVHPLHYDSSFSQSVVTSYLVTVLSSVSTRLRVIMHFSRGYILWNALVSYGHEGKRRPP